MLRASDFDVTAVIVGDELIAVEPGDTTGWAYGLALDIGTTTVVAAHRQSQDRRGGSGQIHAQPAGQLWRGCDLARQFHHDRARRPGRAAHGHCGHHQRPGRPGSGDKCGVPRTEIYEAVAVGNATMLHLLLGIHPEPISVAPFIPCIAAPVTLPASDTGLCLHPQARLSTLPHLGAYVGADIVAGVLATGLARNKDGKQRLYIDVGTNGEIVLGSAQRTVSTAAPAGPAFEGAQIRCGMRASAGAIEGVRITDTVQLQIIGGEVAPVGICGSGLVDVVAELIKCGLVDASGRMARPEAVRGMLPDALINRLIEVNGIRAFLLSEPEHRIYLTQPDIRALQFAKGAIAAGVDVLMQELGIGADDLHEVMLAGSFGSYINPASARLIGLVPWVPVERIVAVGNAAGEGAKIALLSFREREAANRIPQFVEYLELSGRPEFNDIFTDALRFPEVAVAQLAG